MNQPELYKDIEIRERNFRLNKMDARTGSYMLVKLTKIIAPLIQTIDLEDLDNLNLNDINLTELMSPLLELPEKEFRYIQDNCLRVVEEILPGDTIKIIDKYGTFQALNIEFDTFLVMNLTVQSLIFNVKGFFDESVLNTIMKKLNISQQSLKM
ncbi:TPA: phage tail assembly chaperone [Clostridium botulinum]